VGREGGQHRTIGRVHVLERLEQLVDDVLLVDVLQDVGPDDGVQVRLYTISI
jgi:hypothetical protein